METKNLYLAAAEAQWKQGEDGEVIARYLAHALKYMIIKGTIDSTTAKKVSMPIVLMEVWRLMDE